MTTTADGWPDLAVSRGTGSGARDDFTDSEVLRRRFLLRNTGSGFDAGDPYIADLGAFEMDGFFFVCTADMNDDGFLDNGDIAAYLALFLFGDPAADFNGDTFLDNGDINAFIQAFLAGC